MIKLLTIFFLIFSSCLIILVQNKSYCSNIPFKYSVIAIEYSTENVLLDGLPEGINLDTVNKRIVNTMKEKLSTIGMDDRGQKIKIKYQVDYFGHKFNGFWVRYVLKYRLELLDPNGSILFKKNLEVYNKDIMKMIDEMTDDMIHAMNAQ
jgi:hypothetical protein